MQFAIIQKRKYWYALSSVLVTASLIAIAVWGLRLGIDFTGGTLMQVSFVEDRPSVAAVEEKLAVHNLGSLVIQPVDEKDMIIRMRDITENEHHDILKTLTTEFAGVPPTEAVNLPVSEVLTEKRFESIGPSVGSELAQKAVLALVVSIIFIIIYIAYAFRKVSEPVASWKFGVTAIIALVHDVTIIVGVFAVLGYAMQVEIGAMFVTALLTILGFSVHDTIVVFDRTRENLFHAKRHNLAFDTIVNDSVNQTIWRSINTSLSTMLVLGAIFLFGGESIKYFTLALILGILVGTYSSIFIASPLVVDWYQWGKKK